MTDDRCDKNCENQDHAYKPHCVLGEDHGGNTHVCQMCLNRISEAGKRGEAAGRKFGGRKND